MTHDTANPGAGGDPGSQTTDTPRIYVACLAAYNNGHLHGRWIDANQDPDAIQVEISAMLAASPIADAEEWAIHDYEGYEGARLFAAAELRLGDGDSQQVVRIERTDGRPRGLFRHASFRSQDGDR